MHERVRLAHIRAGVWSLMRTRSVITRLFPRGLRVLGRLLGDAHGGKGIPMTLRRLVFEVALS